GSRVWRGGRCRGGGLRHDDSISSGGNGLVRLIHREVVAVAPPMSTVFPAVPRRESDGKRCNGCAVRRRLRRSDDDPAQPQALGIAKPQAARRVLPDSGNAPREDCRICERRFTPPSCFFHIPRFLAERVASILVAETAMH